MQVCVHYTVVSDLGLQVCSASPVGGMLATPCRWRSCFGYLHAVRVLVVHCVADSHVSKSSSMVHCCAVARPFKAERGLVAKQQVLLYCKVLASPKTVASLTSSCTPGGVELPHSGLSAACVGGVHMIVSLTWVAAIQVRLMCFLCARNVWR